MKKPPVDPYWQVACEQQVHIFYLYRQFADKKPVMLFDIEEQRVYAYPYREFAAGLSEKSQRFLAEQYRMACEEGNLVLFIRDNVKRKLVSYSVAIE